MKSDAHDALLRALLARAGAGCRLVSSGERPWASVTFEGARHVVELGMPPQAAAAFVAGIEEAELDLRRHLLADLAIVTRAAGLAGLEHVRLEALTLRES